MGRRYRSAPRLTISQSIPLEFQSMDAAKVADNVFSVDARLACFDG
jgi:hypothetical protein